MSEVSKKNSEASKVQAVICENVYDLESALSGVTDECRLSDPVEVSYEMMDGEGFMRVRTSRSQMLHCLWSACVGKPGYDKLAWRDVERQLLMAGVIP